ncbi:MAG: hypothetical protein AAGP08_04885 [Pseudomonadota bacterium]
MKPNFALNLSHEGISLLHRAGSGWAHVGDVALDAADLTGQLTELRRAAAELDASDLTCKLVIPNSQILYTEVDAPGPSEAKRTNQIRAGLEGLTPYDVEELVFDWRPIGPKTSDRVQVAVVAQETLREAEAFAEEFQFNPVSFVAMAQDDVFAGEPYFGMTAGAARILGETDQVVPDEDAIDIVPPSRGNGKASTKGRTPASKRAQPVKAKAKPKPAGKTSDNGAVKADRPTARSKPVAAAKAAPGKARPTPAPTPEPVDPPSNLGDAAQTPTPKEDTPAVPVTFASRRAPKPEDLTAASSLAFGASRATAATPTDAKPAAATTQNTSATSVSDFSALDLDDVPDMPAWRQVNDGEAAMGARGGSIPATPVTAASVPQDSSDIAPSAKPGLASRLRVPSLPTMPSLGARKAAIAASEKEAQAMTVFANRGEPLVGGKPKYLGLMLTVALLAAFGIAALWSMLFLGADTTDVGPTDIAALPATEAAPVEPSLAEPAEDEGTPRGLPPLAAVTPEVAPPAPEPAAPLPLDEAIEGAVSSALEDTSPLPETQPETQPETAAVTEDSADAIVPVPVEPVLPAPDRVSEPPPSLAEAERRYATTGIWLLDPPPLADPAGTGRLEGLQTAAIDAQLVPQAFSALPKSGPDIRPQNLLPPPRLRSSFDLDERGLVAATPEGNPSPDGIIVFLGQPPLVPGTRPGTVAPVVLTSVQPEADLEPEAAPDAEEDVPTAEVPEPEVLTPEQELLRQFRPAPRPAGFDDTQNLNAEDLDAEGADTPAFDLAAIVPTLRPRSVQEGVAADPGSDGETSTTSFEDATEFAVASSLRPGTRHTSVAAQAAALSAQRAADGEDDAPAAEEEAEPVQVAAVVVPTIPSRASVARAATEENAIRLGRVNLIGVYGSPSDRRALVRLKNGRYVKVEVGDRVDGGRVAAIGSDELRYVKSGRNITLKMPQG